MDCANASAVALYGSAGFEHRSLEVCYKRWTDPAVEPASSDLRRPAF